LYGSDSIRYIDLTFAADLYLKHSWEGSVTRKRHSPEEIVGKLCQADDMVAKGRRQDEIARALGISVMTFHRWRKARPGLMNGARPGLPGHALPPGAPRTQDIKGVQEVIRLDELRTENERLRRVVTNLLLEKVRLEEILQSRDPVDGRKPSWPPD